MANRDDIPDVGRNSVVAWFNGLVYSEGSVHEPDEDLQPAQSDTKNDIVENKGFWPSCHSLSGFARKVVNDDNQ